MTKELTQHEKILIYIQNNGGISSLEAAKKLNITKLTTRISELRKAGISINGEWVNPEHGERYMRYTIPKKGS